jgi:predicted amidophosphoribosyltransferase
MKCQHCQQDLIEDVKFCPQCGNKVQTEILCISCNTKLQPGDRFCVQCGTPIISAPNVERCDVIGHLQPSPHKTSKKLHQALERFPVNLTTASTIHYAMPIMRQS